MDTDEFLYNIENDIYFSFVRYNDGEIISLMNYDFINNAFDVFNHTNCDGHNYFNEMNKGLYDAVTSVKNKEYSENGKYIFQISIDVLIYIFTNKIESNGWTYTPIHSEAFTLNKLHELKQNIKVKINNCYNHGEVLNNRIYAENDNTFIKFIDIINKKKVILIGPEYLKEFKPLIINQHIIIPLKNCFLDKDRIIQEINHIIDNNDKGCIFLFCASMATNYIIDKLFEKTLNKHTMIDIGSSFDNFLSKEKFPFICRRVYNPEFIKQNYPSNYWIE